MPYQDCAAVAPCCWFKSNPVHCLRSKNIKHHSPPFIYFVRGKEYVHIKNPEIHQYYCEPDFVKEVSLQASMKQSFQEIKTKTKALFSGRRGATTSKLGCIGEVAQGTEHN